MGLLEMFLWLLGGLAAIVGLCFLVLWLEREFPGAQYDERQQTVRGKAYRLGFCISLLWYFVSIFYIMFGGDTDGMMAILFLGLWTQGLAFHIYCLLNHAALPMSQKPLGTILGYAALAVMDTVNVFLSWGFDGRYPEKPPVSTWMQMSMAVGFGALSILHLIQYLRDRKD